MPIKRSYADHGDACATAHAMELLGDRWTYPIVRELMLAPKRFSELAEGVRGITPATLTTRLRDLESAGLVERMELPAPARATAYEASAWARELAPIFEALGRWAQASPTRAVDGCGLTPDAMVQSMMTMAPETSPEQPLELELRLRDDREPGAPTYTYRLLWEQELQITRGQAPGAEVLDGDSSTLAGVLYEGVPVEKLRVHGDEVRRLVAAFAG